MKYNLKVTVYHVSGVFSGLSSRVPADSEEEVNQVMTLIQSKINNLQILVIFQDGIEITFCENVLRNSVIAFLIETVY